MAPGPEGATRYESSAGELSSPPPGSLSDHDSPSRRHSGRPANAGEIVVGREHRSQPSHTEFQHYQHDSKQQSPAPPYQEYQVATTSSGQQKRYARINGEWVQLTAAGLPRKKPGRKPGTIVKPKGDGADATQAKARKPRKPRDPDAPPGQRKRKLAPSEEDHDAAAAGSLGVTRTDPTSSHSHNISFTASPNSSSQNQTYSQQSHPTSEQRYSPKIPKRDGAYPSSMQSILNADPPSQTRASGGAGTSTMPVRSSGQSYDPIRGNYDPVRETMGPRSPYASHTGSPRAPNQQQASNRSPSIASLIDSRGPSGASPRQSTHNYQPSSTHPRLQGADTNSLPPSPSQPTRSVGPSGGSLPESKKDAQGSNSAVQRPVIKESNFTTIANGPVRKTSDKQKSSTGVSTPLGDALDDLPQDGESRSILDFGKARPGEELQAPTIVLKIAINAGETNKYVNFMRMAEDRYGWDALHPRLAANRDRKARIAAAAASLEKVESGRESGDEMSVDLSDAEGSNPENGGTSGPDAQAKPKKKRNFKEDQYDVDDDFVDDSELLWEAQAAASRDGFFVYSGPLVPEPEKPPTVHEGRPKRGRGGGRGSRGGRGGSTRGTSGTGRGGGPGSRGGSITRKPRITKSEKLQREREKAERESLAQMGKSPVNGYGHPPSTPSFAVSEIGA